jgi:hypothetical protein|nr:MAG TPA: hypothetical protein [Bacteriophage sp.]
MVKKYAELHCNDAEAEIKSSAITKWEKPFRFIAQVVLK